MCTYDREGGKQGQCGQKLPAGQYKETGKVSD